MKPPLVSIGVPIFNSEKYLPKTLDSILAQDYQNLEIILSDNASTDDSGNICQAYSKKDSRIRHHENKTNIGLISNFNRLFLLAHGEFFMWVGSHDVLRHDFISKCISQFERHPPAILCYGEFHEIDENDQFIKVIPGGEDTRGLSPSQRAWQVLQNLGTCFMSHALIRSEALKQSKLFPEKSGADVLLITELSLLGEFCPTPTIIYMRAFSNRFSKMEEKTLRLVAPEKGNAIGTQRMLRYPYLMQKLEVSRVIYRSNLSMHQKFKLLLKYLSKNKTPALKELLFHPFPKSFREIVKRLINQIS